jgi:hypothetical protein
MYVYIYIYISFIYRWGSWRNIEVVLWRARCDSKGARSAGTQGRMWVYKYICVYMHMFLYVMRYKFSFYLSMSEGARSAGAQGKMEVSTYL